MFRFLVFCLFQTSAIYPSEYILVTSLYNEVNPIRKAEYIEALTHQLNHIAIKKIHVFYDQAKDNYGPKEILAFLKKNGVSITYTNQRPTFKQIFNLVNWRYPGENIIISNADIFFDDTLFLLEGFDLTNKMIALTRWDTKSNGELEKRPSCQGGYPSIYSQDVWIFSTPIINFDDTSIALGTRFCDGYIAYKAYAAGLKVFNPCLSIVTHHLHKSGLRTWPWTNQEMAVLDLPWCTIEDIIYGGVENIGYP